jgi:FlaA1/EpsC-like NDP-sugar epimerase
MLPSTRSLMTRRWLLLSLLMVTDCLIWIAALLLAMVARYAGDVGAVNTRGFPIIVALALVLQLAVGIGTRLYRSGYRIATLDEAFALIGGAVAVGIVLLVIDLMGPELPRLAPLSVVLSGTCAAALGMVVVRVLLRMLSEASPKHHAGVRTLVFGAGEGGNQVIRSMLADVNSQYAPVGLIDDSPAKRHLRMSGVRVLGARDDIAEIARATQAEVLLIAVPSGGADLYRQVSKIGLDAGLDVKVLPDLSNMIGSNRATIRDIRDIDVTDLLGRHQIDTDVAAIADYLRGKRVLVTGAGGSIGSELCRQIHPFEPSELLMLDRDESGLHAVSMSLYGKAMMDSPNLLLADIRDADVVARLFADRRPEVVFHAAALKHLPMLERYPEEGYRTNVLGTLNVLRAAEAASVSRVVNISTDKAANPTSVLGQTKRLAEQLTAWYARRNEQDATYLSVRFGNVLGSRGSVLMAFAEQIARGGPVTVTHKDVTRYFMTIPEASQLVIQAGAIGSAGEVLVLDMGDPVRIYDVATQLVDMSGKHIDIVFTGLRKAEKLHEELLGDGEFDERPIHPLISHVHIEPMDPRALKATPFVRTPASSASQGVANGRNPAGLRAVQGSRISEQDRST